MSFNVRFIVNRLYPDNPGTLSGDAPIDSIGPSPPRQKRQGPKGTGEVRGLASRVSYLFKPSERWKEMVFTMRTENW